MTDTQTSSLNVKTILILIVVALVVAVLVTLAQTVMLGKANAGITGSVVGAIVAGLAISAKRKRVG